MKSSWITGIVTLYLIILGAELMATGGTGGSEFTNVATENTSIFTSPVYVSVNVLAWLDQAAQFLAYWAALLLLWSPTVFSGQMIWVWWFVCFPIDCAMIFTIFTIVKGVGSA